MSHGPGVRAVPPYQTQRPPKRLPFGNDMGYTHERERPDGDFPTSRTRTTGLCRCGRDIQPGFRFCDLCGAPVGYTGKTERLDQGPRIDDYGPASSPFWK